MVSIIPSISELERFKDFLNVRFKLNLPDDLIINIEQINPNLKGFFRSCSCANPYELAFKQKKLNSIVISSNELKNSPFETMTHEVAHYINHINGVKDCSNNQYHNKHFKIMCEKLLLSCDKGNKGFAITKTTPEFDKMLLEFKPNNDAFNLFQNLKENKEKSKSRLLLFSCACGCKVRTAKNEDKPLKAICQYCNNPFIEVFK